MMARGRPSIVVGAAFADFLADHTPEDKFGTEAEAPQMQQRETVLLPDVAL